MSGGFGPGDLHLAAPLSRTQVALQVFAAVFTAVQNLGSEPSAERSAWLRDVAILAFDAADEFMAVQSERGAP